MGIQASRILNQLLMVSAGDDPAILHDVDDFRVADGGETVGDDDGGAALHELVEGVEERIGAFLRKAQAMEMRWRWPPERLPPFSPTWVS